MARKSDRVKKNILYQCSFCESQLDSQEELERHEIQVHGEALDEFFTEVVAEAETKGGEVGNETVGGTKKKTKSFTKAPNFEDIDAMSATRGLSEKTIKKRASVETMFNEHAATFKFKNLDELCQEDSLKADLDRNLCAFFDSFTVGPEELLPMKNYADATKSHLKTLIKEKTQNRFDISDNVDFPKFNVSN